MYIGTSNALRLVFSMCGFSRYKLPLVFLDGNEYFVCILKNFTDSQ